MSRCARGVFTRALCCCLCSNCGYCCYDERRMEVSTISDFPNCFSPIKINDERSPFLFSFSPFPKNASTGEREAHEKEEAAGGVGAAATPVAGAVLRARERVEFHEHGGDEEQQQPEGRGVEPRLGRQAQRHYTRADQHLPGRHALLHRRGRIHSSQVGRLVLCGYVRMSPFHSLHPNTWLQRALLCDRDHDIEIRWTESRVN